MFTNVNAKSSVAMLSNIYIDIALILHFILKLEKLKW
jgi:hypothetical protein